MDTDVWHQTPALGGTVGVPSRPTPLRRQAAAPARTHSCAWPWAGGTLRHCGLTPPSWQPWEVGRTNGRRFQWRKRATERFPSVPVGWGYFLIKQRNKLSQPGVYFQRLFPFLMTACTTRISTPQVPGVSLIF